MFTIFHISNLKLNMNLTVSLSFPVSAEIFTTFTLFKYAPRSAMYDHTTLININSAVHINRCSEIRIRSSIKTHRKRSRIQEIP